jgi:hypothetical protein
MNGWRYDRLFKIDFLFFRKFQKWKTRKVYGRDLSSPKMERPAEKMKIFLRWVVNGLVCGCVCGCLGRVSDVIGRVGLIERV